MTADRAAILSPEITPDAEANVPEQNTPTQESAVESIVLRRFTDFCAYEGVDVTKPLGPIAQPLIAEQARRFILNNVIEDVREGQARLVPAATLESQMVLYYQQTDLMTTSPARKRQQKAFRKQHIDIALARSRDYAEIGQARELLDSAIQEHRAVIVYATLDLITAYGMTLKKLGVQAGHTALGNSQH